MNFVGVSNTGSACRSHPSGQLCASCATNFRETGQDSLMGRRGLGKQILLTGQVLNVVRYRCIRGKRRTTTIRSVRAKEEEKYGYHGCSTVIIFRRIAVDYMYPALSNRSRSQIPARRRRFINECYTAKH